MKLDKAAFSAVRDDSTEDFTAKLESFGVSSSHQVFDNNLLYREESSPYQFTSLLISEK